MQASLLEFFGKSNRWPHGWAPGQPFDNTFWLRSTAVEFAAVMDYADGAETGVALRAAVAVEARRAAYLRNDLIRDTPGQQAWADRLAPVLEGVLAGSGL